MEWMSNSEKETEKIKEKYRDKELCWRILWMCGSLPIFIIFLASTGNKKADSLNGKQMTQETGKGVKLLNTSIKIYKIYKIFDALVQLIYYTDMRILLEIFFK